MQRAPFPCLATQPVRRSRWRPGAVSHQLIAEVHREAAEILSGGEHLATLDVQIPSQAGRYVTKLGPIKWRQLNAILFDDVRYFGATSEACARKLLEAGFGKIYAIYLGQNQP